MDPIADLSHLFRMVPISHYYLDREPPNAASVRDSIHRRSVAATTPTTATSLPPTLDASEAPEVTSDGAAAVPTLSTGDTEAGGISLPPTPAPKDTPAPSQENFSSQPEGIEPAPHPQVDDVEGPITTTVAVPADESIEESQDGLATSASEDKMDEISLGGGSVRGDADQEDVDLS